MQDRATPLMRRRSGASAPRGPPADAGVSDVSRRRRPCESSLCRTAIRGDGFASPAQCVGADDRVRGTVGDDPDRQRRRPAKRGDRPGREYVFNFDDARVAVAFDPARHHDDFAGPPMPCPSAPVRTTMSTLLATVGKTKACPTFSLRHQGRTWLRDSFARAVRVDGAHAWPLQ